MKFLTQSALYTDYYELTMAQGYYLSGRAEKPATFDYFFRAMPFQSGYVVFAGLSDLLHILNNLSFTDDELHYLKSTGFTEDFINYLRDFKFTGDVYSVREGELVFPQEPVIRVEGTIFEAQLIETLLLNIINYESLVATKAARIRSAAGTKKVLDFGLRRAQGYGGIHASKAAIIGGIDGTSNVLSSYLYDLQPSGTMAHSWIQAFEDELTAFRKYAEYYPDSCVLLVDTYDTLNNGLPNAIRVAKELEEKGHKMVGIRLDSGDLAYYSRRAREQLDAAGLEYVSIAVSNQLDEYLIRSLQTQDAPIDLFGVGTRLVTGNESPALDGVYKLSSYNNEYRLKISENVEKITLPGPKNIYRYIDANGHFYADGITLAKEDIENVQRIYHPYFPEKSSSTAPYRAEPLLVKMMEDGAITGTITSAHESHEYLKERLAQIDPEYKRFDNPHYYKVGLSKTLMDTRDQLIRTLKNNFAL